MGSIVSVSKEVVQNTCESEFYTEDGFLDEELVSLQLQVATNVATPIEERSESLKSLAALSAILPPSDILLLTTHHRAIDPIISITQEIDGSEYIIILYSLRILQDLLMNDNHDQWKDHFAYLLQLSSELLLSQRFDVRFEAAALLEQISSFVAPEHDIDDIIEAINLSLEVSVDCSITHHLVRSIKKMLIWMDKDQRQRSCCKLLFSLIALLEPTHKTYTESLVYHVLCIISLASEDEVVAGMIIQTDAIHNLVLVINHRWGLQTCNLAASCILLLYSYAEQYHPLLNKTVLLSLYKSFIRSSSFLSQSLALEAVLQMSKTNPKWFLEGEGISVLARTAEFLSNSYKDLQLHSLGILSQIAPFLNDKHTDATRIFKKAIPLSTQLLQVSTEHQTLGLSLIDGLSKLSYFQQQITSSGVLEFLLQSISSEDSMTQLSAMKTLNQLSHNENNKREILCRSSVMLGKLLTLTKDHQTEEIIAKKAVRTILSLSAFEANKLKVTQAGAVEPLFAMCLADLELNEAQEVIKLYCNANNIQVQFAAVIALLHLTKRRKIIVKLNNMNLHEKLLQMLLDPGLCDEKILTQICLVLGRLASICDNVKDCFMEDEVCELLLELLGKSQNADFQCEVVALFGCALMSSSKNVGAYCERLVELNVLELWKDLLSSPFSQLRHRVVNILRLLAKREDQGLLVANVFNRELLDSIEDGENDSNILRDLRSLFKILSRFHSQTAQSETKVEGGVKETKAPKPRINLIGQRRRSAICSTVSSESLEKKSLSDYDELENVENGVDTNKL